METFNLFIDQLLGLPFVVGFVFVLAGFVQFLFPPKNINSLYGYRTKSSMKSEEIWQFAQSYSAKKMILGGVFLLLTSLIKLVWTMNQQTQIIMSFLLISAATVALIIFTEKAIKSKFPKSE